MRRILAGALAILIAAAAAHALGAGKAPASQPATQPTTKPAEKKVFKSLVEVIAKIPKEHLPSPPADPKYDEKAKALDAWGREQLDGAKITMPLAYGGRTSRTNPKTGEIRYNITMRAPRGAPYQSSIVLVTDKAGYDRFAKVELGFVCMVTGDVLLLGERVMTVEATWNATTKKPDLAFNFLLTSPTFAPVK